MGCLRPHSKLVTGIGELGFTILPGKDKRVKEWLFLAVGMEKEPKNETKEWSGNVKGESQGKRIFKGWKWATVTNAAEK